MNVFNLAASLTLDKKNYEDGLNQAENQANKSGGKISSIISTVNKVAVAGLAASATAVGVLAKKSFSAYAEYEQMVGGVQKLYGTAGKSLEEYAQSAGKSTDEIKGEYDKLTKAQDLVMKNAQNAYKTAGMSTTQYMEQATSLSASLINSLGGDTVKAAEQTDVAMKAIADNYNTFGGDMTMIQGAFQGFAKQNYTMLDNLKLGYGGTKTEMERLIADANTWAEANGKAADLSIDSFSDVVTAIDYIQQKQQIAGTTAREASTTISGSIGSVKAAWDNLMTGIADPENQDIGQLISNFADSLIVAMKNSLPRIREIVEGMSEAVKEIWNEVLPELEVQFPELKPVIDKLQWLIDNGPVIAAVIAGVVTALETFTAVEKAVTIATEIMNGTMMANPIGLIVAAIAGLVVAFMTLWNTSESFRNFWIGLWDGIQSTVGTVVGAIVGFFTETLPNGIQAAIDWFANLPANIANFLGQALTAVGGWVVSMIQKAGEMGANFLASVVKFFAQLPSNIWSVLTNVIGKVGSFAVSLASKGADAAKNLGKNIINGIKHLPKEMLNWGKDMIQGLIDGIKNMIGKVGDAVKGVADKIKGFLHFSRPDEGPLREYEKWMPDMIRGLTSSLDKSSPSLINKVKDLASDMSDSLKIDGTVNAMSELHQIPEDFDPLDGSPRSTGGGSTYIINVNQPVSTPDEMANAIRVESQYGLIEGVPI